MKITGKSWITVDGIGRLAMKEGLEFNLGGQKREAVIGDTGVVGYTETPVHAEIKCITFHSNSTDLAKLNDITDSTITLETDTGKIYSFTGMFLSEPAKVKAKGGEIDLTFQGIKGQGV